MPDKAQQTVANCPPADRRMNLRKPLLVLRVRLDDGRKAFFGYAKNISKSGMFIASINPRSVGEQFDVEIALPAPLGLTFSCRCEVVWKRNYCKTSDLDPGMGLHFLDIAPQTAAAIDTWIAGSEASES